MKKTLNKSLYHVYLLAKWYSIMPMSFKEHKELSQLNREYHYEMLNKREPIEQESYSVEAITLDEHIPTPYTGTSRLRVNNNLKDV